MARIRSDKPEAYQSETLAEISLAAERTFKGMATIADDRGRLADKPAQINGELWSMRVGDNHTRDDLEAELNEMVGVGLVCRYAGCDGKRYLHLVKWDQHQKIDRPSKSRLPRCPLHQTDGPDKDCGKHEGQCEAILDEPSRQSREPSRIPHTGESGLDDVTGEGGESSQGELVVIGKVVSPPNGHSVSEQGKRKSSRQSREPSMQDRGSRTVDRGSRTVDQIQPAAAADEPRPSDLTVTQRSKRIADTYADVQPMCKWPAVNGVIIRAIKSEKYTDGEIQDAVLRLAAEGRSVTVDELRIELEGLPAPRQRGNSGQQKPDGQYQRAMERARAREAAT